MEKLLEILLISALFAFPAEGVDPEFRSFFVATVDNIDWPLTPEETTVDQQLQLTELLDVAKEMNLNAVLLQVRPAADALYNSDLEPWSRWLTGTQGIAPDPFYDPLEFAVTEAHNRGLELHAWINPYRGGLQTDYENLSPDHICNTMREYCYIYDEYLWLDPGADPVIDHLLAVVTDLVSRYDLDGIHMDDYFYPYPNAAHDPFPDDDTYADYVNNGGQMTLSDWRRDNVNRMVENVYSVIHNTKQECVLSISPFGLYRPGEEGGQPSPPIEGFDPYEEQYADAKLWLQNGWVDVMAPQLYWEIDPPEMSFPILLDWWLEQNVLKRNVYPADCVRKIASEDDWPVQEILDQVNITQDENRRSLGSLGNIHFSAKYFRDNTKGIRDTVTSYLIEYFRGFVKKLKFG